MPDQDEQFSLYRSEITRIREGGQPIDEHRQSLPDGTEASGYWRVHAARTKVSWPLLIWIDRQQNQRFVQWGAGKPKPFDGDEYAEFRAGTFMNCAAILKADWQKAIETGKWADGLNALPPAGAEERHELAPGANMAGADDDEARDAYAATIVEKLQPLVQEAVSLNPTDQASAERLAKLRDDIAEIGKLGEQTRKTQKAPLDALVAVVQNRWDFLKRATAVAASALERIESYKRAEQRRLETEARKKREAEAEQARKDEEERLRLEAEQHGQPVDEQEIAARAEEKAAETLSEPVAPVAAPVVRGSATARAATKAKVAKGTITDIRALAEHFIHSGDEDFAAYMAKRADAAARAKITLPGMKVFSDG